MDEARARRRGLVLGAAVVLLTIAQVAIPLSENTWIYRDGRFYVNVNENLLDNGSLEDPFARSWYNGELGWNYNLPAGFSNVALGRNGEHYHFRPWLMPVLSTPFYWAFGLIGVLLFNMLGFGVAAFGAERFAREYAPDASASLAAMGLLLVGGVRARAYDYSVDVLLIACVGVALAALVTRRGVLAGLLIGAAVLIKPPSIVLALPCAMVLWERKDKTTFLRALVGGGIALGLGGLMNTYLFGRPWWFGYSRVLIVENGQQAISNSADTFDTPWEEGLRDMWKGEWGVAKRWGAFALCLVGHAALVRKHPRYVISSLAVLIGLFLLFSRYPWRYDRFLFGAFALQVPALAAGLHTTGRGAVALAKRLKRRVHPSALIAAVLAVAAAMASFGTSPSLPERMGRTPYVVGAMTLGGQGTFDFEAAGVDGLSGEDTPATRTRFGTAIARAPIPAVVAGGAAYAMGGHVGLLLLHLLLGGLLVYFVARLAARVVRPGLGGAVAVGVSLLPPWSDAMVLGGAELYAAALVAVGLALAMRRRWMWSAALFGLAGWLADAPLLLTLVPVAWAWKTEERRVAVRVLVVAVVAVAVHALGTLLLIGRPFASPHEFVFVSYLETAAEVPQPSFAAVWDAAWAGPNRARALLPLFLIGPVGVVYAGLRKDARLLSLLGGLAASALVPSAFTDGAEWSVLAMLPLAVGAAAAFGALRAAVERLAPRLTPKVMLGGAAVLLVGLVVVGAVRRSGEAVEPMRIATPYAVRHAEVTLGDVPCDFLAWEMMSWECAAYDGDDVHRAGLHLPQGTRVPGYDGPMLLVPSAQHRPRSPRVVAWTLPARPAFVLHYAPAPGPYDAEARIVVRIDGEVVGEHDVPRDAAVESARYDTSGLDGEVRVEVEMRLAAAGTSAAVAIDGGFE